MIRILFVCHGNICRSPMAEFIMKKLAKDRGAEEHFQIDSAAVATDEIYMGVGNPIYPPAREELRKHGINCDGKRARLMKKEDYEKYDLLIGMDEDNLARMKRIAGGDRDNKMHLLLDFTDMIREIDDPWYSGNFKRTYDDILYGTTALINLLTFNGKLVLASGSPRRKELLVEAGINFIVDKSDADENIEKTEPSEYVKKLSVKKVKAVIKRHENDWILGADTVVVCDGEILGKPHNAENSERMLKMLSGKTHKVITGVTLLRTFKGKIIYSNTFSSETLVTFNKLTDEVIDEYVATGEPFDKAGAYAIQGKGAALVKEISGDRNNVIGLPVDDVLKALRK